MPTSHGAEANTTVELLKTEPAEPARVFSPRRNGASSPSPDPNPPGLSHPGRLARRRGCGSQTAAAAAGKPPTPPARPSSMPPSMPPGAPTPTPRAVSAPHGSRLAVAGEPRLPRRRHPRLPDAARDAPDDSRRGRSLIAVRRTRKECRPVAEVRQRLSRCRPCARRPRPRPRCPNGRPGDHARDIAAERLSLRRPSTTCAASSARPSMRAAAGRPRGSARRYSGAVVAVALTATVGGLGRRSAGAASPPPQVARSRATQRLSSCRTGV